MPSLSDRIRWNRRYSDPSFIPDWAPDVVLAQKISDLPKGRALDMAAGVGANSLFLAKRGYHVDVLDMSDVAIETLRRAGDAEGVSGRLELIRSDARDASLPRETYDLVICFRFFFPNLAGRLIDTLKPGGVLISRAFTTRHLRYKPDWPMDRCVAPGELPGLFAELESMTYEEADGPNEAFALFLGRKPAR